ncbi:YjdJ family protein [Lysinibacillus xylanilyticus]|uniref:YjdJ family protein n=1 Tax=Lysinibacillus xylanilyticus TaxID=582475 RepID=UPI002B23EF9A|nr:YjdJ family protein [Lysinibacillus xylanilyticus]MEB2301067.1 YjdJ family protein [Lysinibacillus xylanilyticus]
MFKYVIQLILGFLTLLMSTAISWYEGSGIIDNPFEWKYSTPFSQLFNNEIISGQDISQLDYFVYAAKFQPFFPTIMTVSVLYIFTVLFFFIYQLNRQLAIILSGIISCVFIVISGIFFNSSTVGGNVFFWITAVCALVFMCITISLWYKKIQCLSVSTST